LPAAIAGINYSLLGTDMKKIDKYEIIEEIGDGGFAKVYRAYDPKMKRNVALKMLNRQSAQDPEVVKRFNQEARIAAGLKHPHIIPVHDFDTWEGVPFLTMQLIEGYSLDDFLKKKGNLSLSDALPILEQIADALDHLAKKRLVHRDIKPANVLLEKENNRIRVFLTDFGLVRSLDSNESFTGDNSGKFGTPLYMSPEQWLGTDDITPLSDVYALGVLAYELLTGRPPFYNAYAIYLSTVHETPPSPRKFEPELSEEVEKVLLKVLAKEPSQRFESAGAFIDSLKVAAHKHGIKNNWHIFKINQKQLLHFLGSKLELLFGKMPLIGKRIAFLLVLVLVGLGINNLVFDNEKPNDLDTNEILVSNPTPIVTETVQISENLVTAAIIRPVNPGLGSVWERQIDGMKMVYVPSGIYRMGSVNGFDDEKPEHDVALDGFWIDQTEITNEQFALFVDTTGYQTTAEEEGRGYVFSAGDWIFVEGASWQYPKGPTSDLTGLEQHPVVLVSWRDATEYCSWVGGQLPTEAQWEYAARGKEGYIFPWGNKFDGSKLNYCDINCPLYWADKDIDDSFQFTAPVGIYEKGASWVGALDMAGNVWEWVNDWYEVNYYEISLLENPTGPARGQYKVLRGGGWTNDMQLVRSSDRDYNGPSYGIDYIGFRCAHD
jgi:eukaryotic-like serine/threonine-protein kinase